MKALTIDDVKAIGLDTLCYFVSLCKENDLKYYLAYGTLLGAIRHCGYIPWDDDIDVWVPRSDYDKLVSICKELDTSKYKLLCPELTPGFLSPFAKLSRTDTVLLPSRFTTGYLYGCSIDVFPLDFFQFEGDIDSATEAFIAEKAKHQLTIGKYHAYTDGKRELLPKHALKKALYLYSSARYGSLAKRVLDLSNMYADNLANDGNGYLVTVAGNTLFDPDLFSESINVTFEGYSFSAPSGFDGVLTRRYGDYLTPPPLVERVIPHSFSAFLID